MVKVGFYSTCAPMYYRWLLVFSSYKRSWTCKGHSVSHCWGRSENNSLARVNYFARKGGSIEAVLYKFGISE